MSSQGNKEVTRSDSNEGFEVIFTDEIIIEGYGSERYFRLKPALRYFARVIFLSCCVSIPSIIFGVGLSFLPWNHLFTQASVMFLAMIYFGGFIVFYLALVRGKSSFTTINVLGFLFFGFLWPLTLIIFLIVGFPIWYYYLDFLYFFFGFTPMSLLAGWIITQKAAGMTILFGIAELCTIVGALGYMFFLFPIFTRIGSIAQLFWVTLFHPLFFELFLALGPRILLKLHKDSDPKLVVLATHSMFHYYTIGKMVLSSIGETWVLIVAIVVTSAIEFVDRITLFRRDELILNRLYSLLKISPEKGEKETENAASMSSHLLNTRMVIEFSGIIIACAMMMLFEKHGEIFSFNTTTRGNMFIALSLQLLLAIAINLLCSIREIRTLKHDLLISWMDLFTAPFIAFIVYGNCFMGLLGMIYVTLQLDRPF